MPRGATIEAHGRRGDFDITDIAGNIEISSDNAGVRLQNIGGDVRIDLRRSDIVRAISVKGELELKGRGSDVELQGVEGPVTITGTYNGVLQFRNLSKPLRFHGQQTELNIEKLPGQVRMALGDLTASNLIGPVHLIRLVVEGMKERRSGRIVNITSAAGLGTSITGTTFYSATKAALAMLTRRFAMAAD